MFVWFVGFFLFFIFFVFFWVFFFEFSLMKLFPGRLTGGNARIPNENG